ncbi:biotin/lipoyl-binding protein [Caloramator sp. Dgby_cultured_2]|uniref:biotin/lipoyl-binding protein n=1 Tax=Caloramator sp. Dgby_cultured_2 TaxID=3029174 RepID=UPI00237DCC7B|nr:biotin/lipoyl-binding protein [Caloramator sp. Dgby_cultured_2]WDU83454.1 biotin/lipoyl-binding protein [Caloramator sp. Dgby_cultured_2]
MKKMKVFLTVLLLLIVLGVGGGLYIYFYNSSHYIITENAQVSANMIAITPELTGKVETWNVKEGDYVKKEKFLDIRI